MTMRRVAVKLYALSLKQPWAALLAAGRKTVEIRRWHTYRRGLILIHAARSPDPRDDAWKHLSPELLTLAEYRGGVIGAARLLDVRVYRNREAFGLDQTRHLNDPAWFQPPGMFGFVFDQPAVLPFHLCPGNVRLFTVDDYPPEPLAALSAESPS
jgi:hypothetical protein